MPARKIEVVTIPILQLVHFASPYDPKRPCKFINWCFGHLQFKRELGFHWGLGTRPKGRIKDEIRFRIIAPGWMCDHCGEVEYINESFTQMVQLTIHTWMAQHGNQPDLPGFEQSLPLTVVLSV